MINFEDGRKLWSDITYFSEASEKDKELRYKISKVIVNGRFKKTNLVSIVQDTSKEIVDLFYNMKKQPEEGSPGEDEGESGETPFITANYQSSKPRAEEQ